MSCLAAPKVGIPDIPGLSLLLGDISLPLPGLSIDFCCQIDLQLPPLVVPLGSIIGPLSASFETVNNTIQSAVDQLNTLLDQLTIDCPLD